MTDMLSIINRALYAAGSRSQISNITEGSTESDAANVLFQPTFEALARTANWNCLRKQTQLTLIQAAIGTPENQTGTVLPTPNIPWLYGYELPPDCLKVRFLVPNYSQSIGVVPELSGVNGILTPYGNGVEIPYIVSSDVDSNGNPIQIILTNQTMAQAVYTTNVPNPLIWDSQFQAAMVASLAAYFVEALNMNMALMDRAVKKAETIIAQARITDGNEGTTSQTRNASWITARNGHRWLWNNTICNNYYDNMAFPSS